MIEYLKSRLWIVEALVAVTAIWYLHHVVYQEGWNANEAQHVKLEKKDADRHQSEINIAAHSKDAELAAARQWQLDHPVDAVRLCPARPTMQAPAAPAASASAPGGLAGEVHGGDSGSGPGVAGVDIGPMLQAYAAVFTLSVADLREQQAVP